MAQALVKIPSLGFSGEANNRAANQARLSQNSIYEASALAPGSNNDPDLAGTSLDNINSVLTADGRVSPGRKPTNDYGVFRPAAISQTATTSKTYHGISIMFDNNVLGRVQSWSPQMYTRSGTHIYEIGVRSWGRPVDFAPGNAQSFTISCSRVELWNVEIERLASQSFLFPDLRAQRTPFTIYETLLWGEKPYKIWVYNNCWFTGKNEEAYSANGDAKVVANCEISFVSRLQIL